jgi:predicted DNA-binding transcriptional regulator YafY
MGDMKAWKARFFTLDSHNSNSSLNKDGSVCLTFSVADFREVRREILRHGASVEVLFPPELREEVIKEIEKMGKIYR